MPIETVGASTFQHLHRCVFTLHRKWLQLGQQGAVSILFAFSLLPLAIAVMAAVDLSRMVAARAALQRAADSAALSGAAIYTAYTQGDTFNTLAANVATSAFCNATTALPAGFTILAGGNKSCGTQAGPTVSATVAGAKAGTIGVISGSGCSTTNTVVSNATCGFVVTVSATATTDSLFFGDTRQVSVTAAAINPFIDIGVALSASLKGGAWNANSVWVYPLLLDATGSPAVTPSNPGALPDTSACTGDPTQTSCGAYSMIASTNYANCPNQTKPACTVNGTTFGPGGAVQNVKAGAAVITATTPLGVALVSVSGGGISQPSGTPTAYGYDNPGPWGTGKPPYKAPDGCVWPWHTSYNTWSQAYSPSGAAIYPWQNVAYWFYSSYLSQNLPPSQKLISQQGTAQSVKAAPQVLNGQNDPSACASPTPGVDYEIYNTTFPTAGQSNCSLYIARDATSLSPDSSYAHNCFSPSSTPGQAYASLSCQAFTGHSYTFFWNDMGGILDDDKDYGNATISLNCTGQPRVTLIQ